MGFLYLYILLNKMVEMLSIEENDNIRKWQCENTRGR